MAIKFILIISALVGLSEQTLFERAVMFRLHSHEDCVSAGEMIVKNLEGGVFRDVEFRCIEYVDYK